MKSKYNNVVIFGASQGIGKALAFEYAKHGCNLVLLSRNENSLMKITEKINSSGGKCFYKKCDVTIKDDVKTSIEFALSSLANIDLAIVNSGLGGPNWMDEFSSSDYIKSFEVNTFGIAYALEILIPIMKKQGYGTIAGVTSLADVRGYGGSSSYSSSKAAASILLEAARVELKKDNIKVITVRPGFVKTAMTDKNEFKMPFLMQPEKAAGKIYRGIEKGKSVVQFPWTIVLGTRIVKIIPNWIYDFGMNLVRPKKKK
ncbi:MAG: SDR family NAD(P)-dependent oxidoreductase [Chlorobi bacterium]|nr:SDR family NAD(P)-dependent oxidoreductase [Chlorobiota bacterium]MCI0715582.1 SDR family NAD(P)-dependent oxidoreductase [Chlorobiota bacterium]